MPSQRYMGPTRHGSAPLKHGRPRVLAGERERGDLDERARHHRKVVVRLDRIFVDGLDRCRARWIQTASNEARCTGHAVFDVSHELEMLIELRPVGLAELQELQILKLFAHEIDDALALQQQALSRLVVGKR